MEMEMGRVKEVKWGQGPRGSVLRGFEEDENNGDEGKGKGKRDWATPVYCVCFQDT